MTTIINTPAGHEFWYIQFFIATANKPASIPFIHVQGLFCIVHAHRAANFRVPPNWGPSFVQSPSVVVAMHQILLHIHLQILWRHKRRRATCLYSCRSKAQFIFTDVVSIFSTLYRKWLACRLGTTNTSRHVQMLITYNIQLICTLIIVNW